MSVSAISGSYASEFAFLSLSDVICVVRVIVPFLLISQNWSWIGNEKKYLKALCNLFSTMHIQWTILTTHKRKVGW